MAHQVYENVVLSDKINDILTTQVGITNYLTIDNSLAENAGMKKKEIRALVVGIPNVGKSTFLSRVTNAKPKIANYHFTTLEPNLGVISVEESKSFVMADIAGIIEGASHGAGLGFKFLKHIERTRVLIHVVDVSGSEGRDPIEDFEKINNELAS